MDQQTHSQQNNQQHNQKGCQPPTSGEIFKLSDVDVVRDGRNILHVDGLTINRGEALAVLGPNGSGKSTLINVLTRVILPLYKENPPVLIYGCARPITEEMRSVIGVVSHLEQDKATVHLSVHEVLLGGFFGSLGVPRHKRSLVEDWMETKVIEVAEAVGVHHLLERDMKTLSTGQQRRVLIGRSLIHNPEVLVFDEPCSGLDPQAMYEVRQTIERLAQAEKTIILVTHQIEDIMPSFSRVIMIKDGAILCDADKTAALTTDRLTELFGFPLTLHERNGRYQLWEEGASLS